MRSLASPRLLLDVAACAATVLCCIVIGVITP